MFDLTQLFISSAWAQAAAPMAQPAKAPGLTDIISPQVLMILIIFAIWFFVVILPQSKQREAQIKTIKNLQQGDKVVTGSGFYGTIIKILEDETVMLEIAPGVEVKILRSSIHDLASKVTPVIPAGETKAEK